MTFLTAFLLLGCLSIVCCNFVDLQIYYPDDQLAVTAISDPTVNPQHAVFYLWVYSCEENHINSTTGYYTFPTTDCPGGEPVRIPALFPNVTVFNTTDRKGLNHWTKRIELGTVWTGSIYVSISSYPTAIGSTIPACNKAVYMNPMCTQIGMPWSIEVTPTVSHYDLYMFPAFGYLETGLVEVILPYFPSDLLYPMTRNISVYIPPTLLQNHLSREVHIMILNDGSINDVQTYALHFGFEQAVTTGVIPESIMIGVPQSNSTSNRQFELTYAECYNTTWGKYGNQDAGIPPEPSAYYGCPGSPMEEPAGGNDQFLLWVNGSVIPAVLAKIGMTRGEVSIMGGSYGGLTACYAPSKFPSIYARGYCFAASAMWNFASLAEIIRVNYQTTGVRPKGIVMELGHEAYDLFMQYDTKSIQNLLQLSYTIYQAWIDIGMSPYAWEPSILPPTKMNSYASAVPGHPPNNSITFYLQRAAVHAVSCWEMGFSEGLPYLYGSQWSAVNATRMQRNQYLQFLSLPNTTTTAGTVVVTSDDDHHEDETRIMRLEIVSIVFIVLFAVSFLALGVVSWWYYQLLLQQQATYSNKTMTTNAASFSGGGEVRNTFTNPIHIVSSSSSAVERISKVDL